MRARPAPSVHRQLGRSRTQSEIVGTFAEANAELLVAQLGLLAQHCGSTRPRCATHRCSARRTKPVVDACSQLTAGAPVGLSSRLKTAPERPRCLNLALRVGWRVHLRLNVRRRVLGLEHPETSTSASNLAGTLRARGTHAESAQLQRETLDVRRRVLGDEHPATLRSVNNLASTLRAQGDCGSSRAEGCEVGALAVQGCASHLASTVPTEDESTEGAGAKVGSPAVPQCENGRRGCCSAPGGCAAPPNARYRPSAAASATRPPTPVTKPSLSGFARSAAEGRSRRTARCLATATRAPSSRLATWWGC